MTPRLGSVVAAAAAAGKQLGFALASCAARLAGALGARPVAAALGRCQGRAMAFSSSAAGVLQDHPTGALGRRLGSAMASSAIALVVAAVGVREAHPSAPAGKWQGFLAPASCAVSVAGLLGDHPNAAAPG